MSKNILYNIDFAMDFVKDKSYLPTAYKSLHILSCDEQNTKLIVINLPCVRYLQII
jgi:hypothetical protein